MRGSGVVLVALLAFGVTVCGPNPENTNSGSATNPPSTATSQSASSPPSGGGPGGGDVAADMLRDPLLWGPDYPAALRTIPALAQAGETTVEILPRSVVGARKYTDRAAAKRDASVAARAEAAPPSMRVTVGAPGAAERKPPPAAAIDFPDDRSVRVGTPDQNAQYINVKARIEQVEQRWGKPERVTQEVLDDGTDRRPITLTLYHYASDGVIVVTTDVNDPHAVDRVYLDTKTVMRAIF
jgi:hypothetical protein